jgi:ATP/maltotriose-dependent transcriptional regulator MalT
MFPTSLLQCLFFCEIHVLGWLARVMAVRGEVEQFHTVLQSRRRLIHEDAYLYLAEGLLLFGDPRGAKQLADRAWWLRSASGHRLERDLCVIARLQGVSALGVSEWEVAEERLNHAVTRARAINFVEEELPALTGLAELHRRRGEPGRAREPLADVWEPAEQGPYPLFHADALNVLAQLERDEGNRAAAVVAATRAFELAWCDGPPFAYHWGLCAARKHLAELGTPEPALPPFDPSKFEPMPVVEINRHIARRHPYL